MVMGPVKVVTVRPALSSAATWPGAMAVPAAVVCGCWVNASVVADPGGGLGTAVMLNEPLSLVIVPASIVAMSVYPFPSWLMLRSPNVATPADAAACDLPESRALRTPGSLPIARVTSPAKLVTTLPTESNTVTCTGGVMLLVSSCQPTRDASGAPRRRPSQEQVRGVL